MLFNLLLLFSVVKRSVLLQILKVLQMPRNHLDLDKKRKFAECVENPVVKVHSLLSIPVCILFLISLYNIWHVLVSSEKKLRLYLYLFSLRQLNSNDLQDQGQSIGRGFKVSVDFCILNSYFSRKWWWCFSFHCLNLMKKKKHHPNKGIWAIWKSSCHQYMVKGCLISSYLSTALWPTLNPSPWSQVSDSIWYFNNSIYLNLFLFLSQYKIYVRHRQVWEFLMLVLSCRI